MGCRGHAPLNAVSALVKAYITSVVLRLWDNLIFKDNPYPDVCGRSHGYCILSYTSITATRYRDGLVSYLIRLIHAESIEPFEHRISHLLNDNRST